MSILQAVNAFIGQEEFGPCNSFSVESLAFSLLEDSNQLKVYELFPRIGASCSTVQDLLGQPIPLDISVIVGAKLPLQFESTDFAADVPTTITLADSFGCESFTVQNENGGDVSELLDLFCDDLALPDLVSETFNSLDAEAAAIFLRQLSGGPFEIQPLSDLLPPAEDRFNEDGFQVLEGPSAVRVLRSFAFQALDIPFVAEFLGAELVAQLRAFINTGFDFESLIPSGYYEDDTYEDPYYNETYEDPYYNETYGDSGEEAVNGIAIIAFFFFLSPAFDVDLQTFPLVEFFNSTIPEGLALLGVDNIALEADLVELYGDELALIELFESEETFEILQNSSVVVYLPLFILDPDSLAAASLFLEGVTVGDVLEIPNQSVAELLNSLGLDATVVETLGLVIDTGENAFDVIFSLIDGDFSFVAVDLANLFPPEAAPVLNLVFGPEIPTDPAVILEEVLNFLIVRNQNLALDFSEPFPQDSVETLQFIALFDPLVAENIQAITAGNITVGEFAELANLPSIIVPVNNVTNFVITPDFIQLNSEIIVEQSDVPDTSSIILPSLVVREGSRLLAILDVNLNGQTITQMTVSAGFGFGLEVALGLVADIDGLLDIGLFNVQQPEDAEEFVGIGTCAASNFGLKVIAAAPSATLDDIRVQLTSAGDEGINQVFAGVISDLYDNFIPNFANNQLKGLLEGIPVLTFAEGESECLENSISASNADNEDDSPLDPLLIPLAAVAAVLLLLILVFFITRTKKIKKVKSQREKNILEGEQDAKNRI